MDSSLYEEIWLAPGYRFADRLTSRYRIAAGHVISGNSAVTLCDVNGEEKSELLGADTGRQSRAVCFSPDGSTLYRYAGELYAKDLASGATRRLPAIPPASTADVFRSLECSPDNSTLISLQTVLPHMVRGGGAVSPYRLYRISTDGSGYRMLYEDPPDCRVHTMACCWRHGFILFVRGTQADPDSRHELWRVDVESGGMRLVCRAAAVGWNLDVHPDGRYAVWSTFGGGITFCSLDDGATTRMRASGTSPALSPDGKTIAFMEDQHRLCVLDMQSGRSRDMIGFEPPNLSFCDRGASWAVKPVWSPDARMLWFAINQTRNLPPPRGLVETLGEASRFIYPVLHNLNPMRASVYSAYKRHGNRHRNGIVDMDTKLVRLSRGYGNSVAWLPQDGHA